MSALSWLLGLPQELDFEGFAGIGFDVLLRDWLVLIVVVFGVVSVVIFWSYLRQECRGSTIQRAALASLRVLVVLMVATIFTKPYVKYRTKEVHRPTVAIVVDASQSMEFVDRYSQQQARRLSNAMQLDDGNQWSRMQLIREWLSKEAASIAQRLERNGYDVQFLHTRPPGEAVGDLDLTEESLSQLVGRDELTALGDTLRALKRRLQGAESPAVFLLSDFQSNAGVPPVGSESSPARLMGFPIHCVGIGVASGPDVSVSIRSDPVVKKNEMTDVRVSLRFDHMTPQPVKMKLTANSDNAGNEQIVVFDGVVQAQQTLTEIRHSLTPGTTGRLTLKAEVQPLAEESVERNNRGVRSIQVIDDFLRLSYIAYEPTWEWRFIKEVFHRDERVGIEGFRTFLSSSDPKVRQSNELFLTHLAATRASFFVNDVVFLGDLPREAISDRFAALVKEYVGVLGGGLVVIGGPRFGPSALVGTEIEDLLPVIVGESKLRDEGEFSMIRGSQLDLFPFMQLDDDEAINDRVWANMNSLEWFQCVTALYEDQATVLAEHPTIKLADGRTPAPLIVHRKYGKGQVVFIAFNEMWRLRRKYGERYYTRFWSKLIYELGMSHALGHGKRFVLDFEDRAYRVGQSINIRVEAYDANYESLDVNELGDGVLHGEIARVNDGALQQQAKTSTSESESIQASTRSIVRRVVFSPTLSNMFEANTVLDEPGRYELRVTDPVTGEPRIQVFNVSNLNAEQLEQTRDSNVQELIANDSGGNSLELDQLSTALNALPEAIRVESRVQRRLLWSTPGWFIILVLLLVTEWTGRRIIHLN